MSNKEQFCKDIIKKYEKERIIKEFVNLKLFDERIDRTNFIQIGLRPLLPKDILENNTNKLVSYDVARSINLGERNYILNQIIEEKKESIITVNNVEEIKDIVKCNGRKKLFAFMSIKTNSLFDRTKDLVRWEKDNFIHGEGWTLSLPKTIHGSAKIIPLGKGIINDNIVIIFPKEDIKIIQKKVKDMLSISDISDHEKYSSDEDILQVSIKERENLKIDLYVRSVIKLNVLNKENIFIFKLKNS